MTIDLSNSQLTVRPATTEEWDSHWNACPYATYFQSRQWSEVWREYTEGIMQPEPFHITLVNGSSLVLPLSARNGMKGLTRNYFMCPGSTYGGWLGDTVPDAEMTRALTTTILSQYGNLTWRLNPIDPSVGQLDLEWYVDETTHILDLEVGPERILSGMRKGHRSSIKKATREGVEIGQAETIDDWREYYDVYVDSLRRWGSKATSNYHWRMFESLARRSGPNVCLWVARAQGRIVAGAVCFSAKHHVVYWHGAALESFFHMHPVNLLLFEIIRHSAAERKHWFDFNPSGGHEGVAHFKRGFGAVQKQCPVHLRQDTMTRLWKTIQSRSRRHSARDDLDVATGRQAA